MKALSLRQPFAELILSGKKKIELRKWNTKFRGEFYIHAARGIYPELKNYLGVDVDNVPRGDIVGKATLVKVKKYETKEEFEKDIGKHCARSYFKGKPIYGFVLENIKRVRPIPYKGKLNFFDVEVYMDCIFCKIVKGEIPCNKVYEDDSFLAFLDIKPLNKGHTLVIPKEHARWVWDVNDMGDYYSVVGKVGNVIRKMFSDWVVTFTMGQEVEHAHVHILPRVEGDGHGALADISNVKEISKEELASLAEEIAKKLS
ncbi:MAG: HIT domain-containing protein [Candidatus Nanoarchaeia archaeon]